MEGIKLITVLHYYSDSKECIAKPPKCRAKLYDIYDVIQSYGISYDPYDQDQDIVRYDVYV